MTTRPSSRPCCCSLASPWWWRRSTSTTPSRSWWRSAPVSRPCCGPSARPAGRWCAWCSRRRGGGGVGVGGGLVGSAGGVAAGLGLASGLLALMDALGLTVPASSPVLDATTVVAAVAVGVVVTLLASLAPPVRAPRGARRRPVAGAVVTGAGIALTIAGTTGEAPAATGLGALAILVGVVALG